jgi:ketosteroid isomerase-like protein
MDISQAFANLNSRFVELVNGHDAHRWTALFSDDGVLVPAGQPTSSGAKALKTGIRAHVGHRS